MSAPRSHVTFMDEDDDEFPLQVMSHDEMSDAQVQAAAQRHAEKFIAEGMWRPNGSLRLTHLMRELGA